MIAMVARMIGAILGLIKKGELTKATEDLDNLYYDALKQDAAFFKDLPEDKLTNTLLQDHNYTNGHLEILAELFNAEAVLLKAKGDDEGCTLFSRKSLKLFEFLDREQKTYSQERINLMNELRSRIA
jgi:hypothetical protein